MGTYDNRIEHNANQLGWSAIRLSAVAAEFGISGASEANISKSRNRVRDLSTETALELDTLLGRFLKMYKAFEPFKLRLDDSPEESKKLLEDFEAGRLVVSVRREEPGAAIYLVYVLENQFQPGEMFQEMQNGAPVWGPNPTPIREETIALTAAKMLKDVGQPCRVVTTSMRTLESKIAKSLPDLGFTTKENDDVS